MVESSDGEGRTRPTHQLNMTAGVYRARPDIGVLTGWNHRSAVDGYFP